MQAVGFLNSDDQEEPLNKSSYPVCKKAPSSEYPTKRRRILALITWVQVHKHEVPNPDHRIHSLQSHQSSHYVDTSDHVGPHLKLRSGPQQRPLTPSWAVDSPSCLGTSGFRYIL